LDFGFNNSWPLDEEPGTHFVYGETSWIFLHELVEAVTELTFKEAFEYYVLHPLGLTSDNIYYNYNLGITDPGGALFSNANAYYTVLEALANPEFLTPESIDLQMTAWTAKMGVLSSSPELNFGYQYGLGGWVTKCDPETHACDYISSAGHAGVLPFVDREL